MFLDKTKDDKFQREQCEFTGNDHAKRLIKNGGGAVKV